MHWMFWAGGFPNGSKAKCLCLVANSAHSPWICISKLVLLCSVCCCFELKTVQFPARCLEMSLGALDTMPCTLAAASQILWEATTRLAMEAQSMRELELRTSATPWSCASAWGYSGTGLWNTGCNSQLKGGAHSPWSCQLIFAHLAQFSCKLTRGCCGWINNTDPV